MTSKWISRLRPGDMRLTNAAIQDGAVVVDVIFRKLEKALWASAGASGGEPWAPLNPRYRRWKELQRAADRASGRKKRSKGRLDLMSLEILVQYGGMRAAFSTEGPGHVAEGFLTATGGKIRVGAQGPKYYVYHYTGTPTMPARPPIMLTDAQKSEIKAGVRRALLPHAMAALRAALRSGR